MASAAGAHTKRFKLPPDAVSEMMGWIWENFKFPYPSNEEIEAFALKFQITPRQMVSQSASAWRKLRAHGFTTIHPHMRDLATPEPTREKKRPQAIASGHVGRWCIRAGKSVALRRSPSSHARGMPPRFTAKHHTYSQAVRPVALAAQRL